jgi:hypothetical protein
MTAADFGEHPSTRRRILSFLGISLFGTNLNATSTGI